VHRLYPLIRPLLISIARMLNSTLRINQGSPLGNLANILSPLVKNPSNDNELHETLRPVMNALRTNSIKEPLTRIGSQFDGGYLLVEKDYSDAFLISAGISDNNDFEYDFANLGGFGHQMDFSIDAPPRIHENLTFSATRLVNRDGVKNERDLTLPDVIEKYLIKANRVESINILKLDIEGYEWEILAENVDLTHFDQVLIELHFLERLGKPKFQETYLAALENLLLNFAPVHITGNNCCGFCTLGGFSIPRLIEMTLVNKHKYEVSNGSTNELWLGKLDRNIERNAPIVLKSW
jgi:hypothetical protein